MSLMYECFYTGLGRQRAVFLGPYFENGRFALDVGEYDEAAVEVSFDPEPEVRKGRGTWQRFDGGLGGGLDGFTALRVNIRKVDGWVKLTIRGGADGSGK